MNWQARQHLEQLHMDQEDIMEIHSSQDEVSKDSRVLIGGAMIYQKRRGVYSLGTSINYARMLRSPFAGLTSLPFYDDCYYCRSYAKLFQDNAPQEGLVKDNAQKNINKGKLIIKMFEAHVNDDHFFREKVDIIKSNIKKLCSTALVNSTSRQNTA